MSRERPDSAVFHRPATAEGIVARTGHFKNMVPRQADATLETLEETLEYAEVSLFEAQSDRCKQHSLTEMSTLTSLHDQSGSDLKQLSSNYVARGVWEQPVVEEDGIPKWRKEFSPNASTKGTSKRKTSVTGSRKSGSRSKASTSVGVGGLCKYDTVLGSTVEKLGLDVQNLNSEGMLSCLMENVRGTQKAAAAKIAAETTEVTTYEIRRHYRTKLADKASKYKKTHVSSKKDTSGGNDANMDKRKLTCFGLITNIDIVADVPECGGGGSESTIRRATRKETLAPVGGHIGAELPKVAVSTENMAEKIRRAEKQASESALAFVMEARRQNLELHEPLTMRKDCVHGIKLLTESMAAASQPKDNKGNLTRNAKSHR
eukprot:NODE_10060_length_1379_cov_6.926518.p1 GENE.NODE_10060_length_1379_cov_6.926518~~NODE_10060_length_1379_cov_6.926518.p1  ORF type:complete len:375 (-),score=47.58 NODE_10060_length_1379_cov_6.926518:170-1294(-)